MAMALRFCQGKPLDASPLAYSQLYSSHFSFSFRKSFRFHATEFCDNSRRLCLLCLSSIYSLNGNSLVYDSNRASVLSSRDKGSETFYNDSFKAFLCSHNAKSRGMSQNGSMPLATKGTCSPVCSSLDDNENFGKINSMPDTGQISRISFVWKQSKIMSLCRAKKWKDPFDYGEDPDMVYKGLFSEGKQSPEEPIPPMDPNSAHGYRKFSAMYNLEITPLALKVRGDVRRCCCLVAGGVYENLLFFPVIQLLKDRYPGVKIDIMAGERAKQTYEINKNVKRVWVFDLEQLYVKPSEYAETFSKLKEEYYDLIISTKLAGWGHAAFLLLTDATRRMSYVYPNVYSAGAEVLLSEAFTSPSLELADAGYNMYADLLKELAKPGKGVPQSKIPPLQVAIGRRVKAVVEEKYKQAGVEKGDFIVFHGIKSASAASMKSKGDLEALLPLSLWAVLANYTSVKPVFVIPHEKERPQVSEVVGEDASVIFITTPGQLAAIINDSVGVVSTNTAALQLAIALRKPSVALFASAEKARLFVSNTARNCAVVSSKTGVLRDIDMKAASVAVTTIVKEALVYA